MIPGKIISIKQQRDVFKNQNLKKPRNYLLGCYRADSDLRTLRRFYINSELAKEGMRHLMLPEWFRWEVSIGHIIGGVLLVAPVPPRIKEWTYVAFGIDFISAAIAYMSIDGFGASVMSPVIMLALLIVSYVCYHRIHQPFKKVTAAA